MGLSRPLIGLLYFTPQLGVQDTLLVGRSADMKLTPTRERYFSLSAQSRPVVGQFKLYPISIGGKLVRA
jgi:hypothetical protein